MQEELDSPVVRIFSEHVDAVFQSLDHLSDQIDLASACLIRTLLGDHKLLVCGNGVSGILGQCVTTMLLSRFEQERPSLPAIGLNSDSAALGAITSDYSFAEIYSRQIHAIGAAGDVLILIYNDGSSGNLIQAIRAAHERELTVIALTGDGGGDIVSLLYPEDIELRVPPARASRIHECHLLILQTLIEMIDSNLFGG